MSHDVLAELQAYRDELANAERYGRAEKAAAIREQIDRVGVEVERRAVEHETRAASLLADGQDVKAAEQQVEARRYRDALTEPGAELETAVQADTAETAVPRKRAGGK